MKEPIKLRQKKLANGSYSLYLDCYINGKRTFEFLRLYLNPGTDPMTKAKNKSALEAAKTIQAKRLIALQENTAGIVSADKRAIRMSAWMDRMIEQRSEVGYHHRQSLCKVRELWNEYAPSMRIVDIDANALTGFHKFLKKYTTSWGDHYSDGTIHVYFNKLSIFLNCAVKEGIISHNPISLLSIADKPKKKYKERQYLTMDEIGRLADTECSHESTKRMFMFCCFCGVRYSDVCKITWRMVDHRQIRMRQTKTDNEVIIPLADNALRWLPERNGAPADALVFAGHHALSTINMDIQRWVKDAGIDKHISFHCSRHTFATLLITYGADLYTTSKLLGHTSVNTTEIYAKVIDKKKEEAVSLIPSLDILK